MIGIPSAESITSQWLTDRLHEAGHETASVRSFTQTQIGTGQIGKCIRFALDLQGNDPTTPRSLVGKFASDDPMSRATGVALKNYIKEVSFYRQLQQRLTIATPRCYFAAIEDEGPNFALLLQDLAPARQGDQLAGCSVEVARAAVLELVGLHAPSWCDESLRGIDWLGEPNQASVEMTQAMYRHHLPGFLERYASKLNADEIAIIERVAQSSDAPFQTLQSPFSLIHIDYRLDNLLIDQRTQPPKISVVDWQSITLGSPLHDVAYFLGAGLTAENRRSSEEGIVRGYCTALNAAGIDDYPWDRCWNDYRRGVFAGFTVTVIASMLVQQTERGDAMFTTMAQRHARHALDLDATEFLDPRLP
ncbi:MAG: aminoglycoside phosphotransferase family protein [Proteobacteria bacterium]|nr:aminoglycoside phosphotransferase family protein [Pseudomonadota bacterium]